METTQTAPEQKRYRVILSEEMVYTIDVIARDEEQALELALNSDRKGEPRCEHCDADVTTVTDDETDFDPVNSCMRCKAVLEDDQYPHCPACIEQIQRAYGETA